MTVQEYLPALRRHWIDYLRVDVSHAGGITGLMKASTLADAYQAKMAFHGPSDISPLAHYANMHIDTAIVNFAIQEFVEPHPSAQEVFAWGYRYSDGCVTPEDVPGLGVRGLMRNAPPGFHTKRAAWLCFRTETGRSTTGRATLGDTQELSDARHGETPN